MPRKLETVWERRQKNGGYITGKDHPITRRMREEEKRKEMEEAKSARERQDAKGT